MSPHIMATKAKRYQRIIFLPGGVVIVQIGINGRVTCTTLPDSMEEIREAARQFKPGAASFERGRGDEYILNNKCEVKYYLNGKLVRHLKD